ncbi:MAG: hypothetical protein QNI99_19445 [Woeseiaceae bacterium]|nr:hypothetical protein [Woeseiaceae bacterium]
MKSDDIDKVLTNEEVITPSPDFLASVMRAVRRQAAALPPMKFPWLRLLPAILAMFVAIMRVFWDLIGFLYDPDVLAGFTEQLQQFASVAARFGVQWIVLAVAVTALSLLLSVSLVGGRRDEVTDTRLRRMLRAAASVVRRLR